MAVYVLLGSELNSRVFQTRVLKIRNPAYSNSSLHLCHSREPLFELNWAFGRNLCILWLHDIHSCFPCQGGERSNMKSHSLQLVV